MPSSCFREDIDPTGEFTEVFQEALALEEELAIAWNRLAELTLLYGVTNDTDGPEELQQKITQFAEMVGNSATIFKLPQGDEIEICNSQEPRRIHFGSDGVISFFD